MSVSYQRRTRTQTDNTPTPQFIACRLCRGTNPMNIAMCRGISIENINAAKMIVINNVPDEDKDSFVAECEEVEKMKMSVVVPPALAEKYNLNNEIVTALMELSYIMDNLTAEKKMSIAFKIINNEVGKAMNESVSNPQSDSGYEAKNGEE